LEPVVWLGKEGVTDGFVAGVMQALEDHELIKVRVLRTSPLEREDSAELVASKAGAALVQNLGRTALLYRPHPTEPKIELPPPKGPGRPSS
jgi:RNA-binding protein